MKYQPVELIEVKLHLDQREIICGRLALNQRRIWFEYNTDFISLGLELSPFKLPLQRGAIPCDDMVFDGLFGLFNDSLPDGWGRLLIDRSMLSHGIPSESLTPLDRLAHVGNHGMGALSYHPSYHHKRTEQTIDLHNIAQETKTILAGETTEVIDTLLSLNGSSAGARPKIAALVSDNYQHIIHGIAEIPADYRHWLIKFSNSLDMNDIGNTEYAYSLMARAAGLNVPDTHLFKDRYFGVKRFDRDKQTRIHTLSLCGLLHADHRIPSLDYDSILKATTLLTKDLRETAKAFRLAAFNLFSHNRDDHSKNFAFLMHTNGEWQLAPAYDLTYSYGPNGEHSTMYNGEGKHPGTPQLLSLAAKHDIDSASTIIEEVKQAIARWPEFAETAGVSKQSKQLIQKSLNTIIST